MSGSKLILIVFPLLMLSACASEESNSPDPGQLFELKSPDLTGIQFANNLQETEYLNYFSYPYMYFGGGVAIFDIDNDGLNDVLLTGNMVTSRLYKNMGQFKFEDITRRAGLRTKNRWVTGVSVGDVNGDGFLDFYLCVSGKDITGNNPRFSRENLLFINNTDGTFKELGEEYKVNDNGMSVQSIFFDLENDGDLDLYITSYPEAKFNSSNEFWNMKVKNPSMDESDHLYRNDGDYFTEITNESGVLNYGLSLNVLATDINNDGFSDLYVSNDFNTPDYFYINNGDGTFSNKLNDYFRQTSNYGMGSDMADFNNDGLIDLIQLDMMPDNHYHEKTNMGAMNAPEFWKTVEYDFNHQYMQNSLQLNTGSGAFSQISQLAGVAETDWSWSVDFFDADLDGAKDLFIANGLRRSVNNNDFNNQLYQRALSNDLEGTSVLEMINALPEEPKRNYAFKNSGGLVFENVSEKWGLDFNGFSNGSAYGDLDGDGDLDLIVNNIDHTALVYENTVKGKSLQIDLKGIDNKFGIGAKVVIENGGVVQTLENFLTRGFQSSVPASLIFAIPDINSPIDGKVYWPSGAVSHFSVDYPNSGKYIVAEDDESLKSLKKFNSEMSLFKKSILAIEHKENEFDDYSYQFLLPYRISRMGPALTVFDSNGDGNLDVFIGNATGFESELYLGKDDGTYIKSKQSGFARDKGYEDVDATPLDVDNDGDLDLFVVSGGNEFPAGDSHYADRLYLNEGGVFSESIKFSNNYSGSSVQPLDYDSDGDIDLFVGGYIEPRSYPYSSSSYLLENVDGQLEINENFGELNLGLVTDLGWVEMNGQNSLVVVGEWMEPEFYQFESNELEKLTISGTENLSGWWNCVYPVDINNDGLQDFVLGNLGKNYKYQAPMKIYGGDIDGDGDVESLLSYFESNKEYPVKGREDLLEELHYLKDRLPTYKSYAEKTFSEIFPESELTSVLKKEAKTFNSGILINKGDLKFDFKPLPDEVQGSSVNACSIFEYEGKRFLVLGGNKYNLEVETARIDGSYGALLEVVGDDLIYIDNSKSGFQFQGEVKQIISTENGFIVGRNSGPLEVYRPNSGNIEM